MSKLILVIIFFCIYNVVQAQSCKNSLSDTIFIVRPQAYKYDVKIDSIYKENLKERCITKIDKDFTLFYYSHPITGNIFALIDNGLCEETNFIVHKKYFKEKKVRELKDIEFMLLKDEFVVSLWKKQIVLFTINEVDINKDSVPAYSTNFIGNL